ncbi:hypothetical protein [Leptothoe kymatousa]|uniref:Uncharacterized protein n=1 Tax=Leptothoe kymatousa TAU-MAC 1615 TaxID=2364775 RepID=A0ABS5Y3T5_9CYAN|nr:hypothetical protein [Leptothoe kymatousa]MBT9312485.1 hypothetical protein [Leptothoe kymatousa TAU-MAC 1615]
MAENAELNTRSSAGRVVQPFILPNHMPLRYAAGVLAMAPGVGLARWGRLRSQKNLVG